MRPHLPWATSTSTAATIPMPTSAAIDGSATCPDRGRSRPLEDVPTGFRGPARVAGFWPSCLVRC